MQHVRRSESDGSAEVMRHALAYSDVLYNLARWLEGDPTQAEDLVQEAYARALGAAQRFEPGSNLKAWLCTILRNVHLDRQRRSRNEPLAQDPEAFESLVEAQSLSAGELSSDQMRALVADEVATAVHQLPEIFRTVILLDLEGLSELEIATIMECAPGTVKSRLSRARAELRQRLVDPALER
jgi:RNA polymerase sigma-70 factor, ECF subfamily